MTLKFKRELYYMECPICLETNFESFKSLSCQHSFHEKCINIWLINNTTCPMCRELVTFIKGKINKKEYKLSINYDHLIMKHETHTSILKFSNIKNIEYLIKPKLVILTKKEVCDRDFVKIKIKSDKAFIIFDHLRINMNRLASTDY